MNQLINIALAEKLSVLDAEYWQERKAKAQKGKASKLLDKLAGDEPPGEGDELPEPIQSVKLRKQAVRPDARPKTLRAGGS